MWALSGRCFLRVVCLFCTVVVSSQTVALATEPPQVAELIKRWQAASVPVKTAKVKCFHLALNAYLGEEATDDVSGFVDSSLTSEQFRILFQDKLVPLVGSEDQYVALQLATTAFMQSLRKVNDKDVNYYWSELTIVQDGSVSMNDEKYQQNRSIRKNTAKIYADYESSVNEATISDSDSGDNMVWGDMRSVDELRFTPEFVSSRDIDKLNPRISSAGGKSKLSGLGFEVSFDSESKFVTYLAGFEEDRQKVHVEEWYALPKRFPGGIELPLISANVSYAKNEKGQSRVYMSDIFVIESAEVNQKISASELNLPVPKGTTIRDATEPKRTKRLKRSLIADQDIVDVTSIEFPPIR